MKTMINIGKCTYTYTQTYTKLHLHTAKSTVSHISQQNHKESWLLQRICSYKMGGCDPLREPETCIVIEQTMAKAKNHKKCCFKLARFW